MEPVDLARVERRARRRYESARVRGAIVESLPIALVIAAALLLAQSRPAVMPWGGALWAIAVVFLWRGQSVGRAVVPGMAAGLVPLIFADVTMAVAPSCFGRSCMQVCIVACFVGGGVSGLLVSRLVSRWRAWAAAGVVVFLTGALGCACVGPAGLGGLLMGFLLSSLPKLLVRPRGEYT